MDHPASPMTWVLERLPEAELREQLAACEVELHRMERMRNALQMMLHARQIAESASATSEPKKKQRSFSAEDVLRRAGAIAENGERPGITEAVRLVLSEAPDYSMKASDMMAVLTTRGWLPPAKNPRKALGATLSRMTNRTKELEGLGAGRYRLRNPKLAAPRDAGADGNGLVGTVPGEREKSPAQGDARQA